MRSNRVVAELLGAQKDLQLSDRIGRVEHLVELLFVRALGALDVAVELGRARRQDEEHQASFLAGRLELGLELGAAINLDRPDREGHAGDELVEEGGRRLGAGAVVDVEHVPAADDVASAEVFVDAIR